MYKRILIPFDFSSASFKALQYGRFFKEKSGAEITLIHIFPWTLRELINFYADTINFADLEKKLEELRKKAEEKLGNIVSQLKKDGLEVNAIFQEGLPYMEVLRESEKGYDLIILGVSHRPTGFGITPWKVTRKSGIPCLVVKETRRKVSFSKVLFPTDFSEYSRKSFEKVKEFVKTFDAELTILNVAELYPPVAGETEIPLSIEDVELLKKRILEKLSSEYKLDGASYSVVEGIDAGTEISEFAQKGKYNLIIMPTHGRTGFERAFLGSVTEKVLKLSKVPVLVLKQ